MPERENNVGPADLDPSEIEKLESSFPAASGSAFAAARQSALSSGLTVLESEDGIIFEVFPDGRRREVKRIEPPTPVERGCKVTLK